MFAFVSTVNLPFPLCPSGTDISFSLSSPASVGAGDYVMALADDASRGEATAAHCAVAADVAGRAHIPRIVRVASVRTAQPHVLRAAYIHILIAALVSSVLYLIQSRILSGF